VINDPVFGEKVLREFGPGKIVLGFDAVDQELMTSGWQSSSGIAMMSLAKRLTLAGAETVIYTNIKKDGMQTGVDWENAKMLSDETGLTVIASGGVATLNDIQQVRDAGLDGVIVGRALYEGNFTLEEAIDVC
jgi:phosphoribosylformimino-5-aminoimidazole carboxamide ribotide isomerase